VGKAVVKDGNSRYVTAGDFRRVFAESWSSLYRLSLLLLGCNENLDQCIELALDECVETASVFQPFAKSWARRCIIRNAFQLTDMRKEESPLAVHTALNGWALHGLAQAFRAEGKNEEATQTEERFHRAWAQADSKLE
jgi:hypothetical protein